MHTLFIAIVDSTAVAKPTAFGVGGFNLAGDYRRKILPNNDGSN